MDRRIMSDSVLDTLVAWGERTHGIRAMILTSTRARIDGPVDEFSDYDVILAVTDPASFAHGDLGWQAACGTPLVRWGVPARPGSATISCSVTTCAPNPPRAMPTAG